MIIFDIVGCKVNNLFCIVKVFFDWDLGDGLHEKIQKRAYSACKKSQKRVYLRQ